ncbi:hydantoinase B/oxoprolinase family protein [Paenibacillus amylolyticus]|nr:hydantoinase B/oxoprolinase family protein [Paenibacillus amylolyticus]
MRCKMTIAGTDIHLDFSGTDPQVRASFNIPTHNQQGHYMLVPALIRYFRTLDPTIPWNSGMIRMVRNYAPPASVLNPEPMAAVGGTRRDLYSADGRYHGSTGESSGQYGSRGRSWTSLHRHDGDDRCIRW